MVMARFGKKSMKQLETCHSDLRELFFYVVEHFDCTVLEGHRDKETQNELFEMGRTKVTFPDSKHNGSPSLAVDVVPYPVDWEDINRMYYFGGFVKGVASQLGTRIRWGGDWDSDNQIKDQTFIDLPHFELRRK